MKEKYFPRTEGDEIIVTRKSDRKTIGFLRTECIGSTVSPYRVAVELAKACDDSNWG